VKRTGILVLGAIALLLVVPGIASAKVPPFTLEASPADPAAGDVVRLTVRFWDDAEHTDPARWPDMRAWEAFLWAHPAGSLEDATPVDLRLVRPGVYRAELTVPSPGRWILCPWERSCAAGPSMAGYPNRIELEVAPPAPVASALAGPPAEPPRGPLSVLALAALAVGAAVLVGRSVRARRT
jgi:hypothetical protein